MFSHPVPQALRTAALAATLSFILLPGSASGQVGDIRPGDHVRIRWEDPAYAHVGFATSRQSTGEVVDFVSGTLLLRRGSRLVSVPLRSVEILERRVGTRPASAPRMAKGSALGFVLGFAGAWLRARADSSVPAEDRLDSAVVGGVLVGAPVGAIVAWLTSRERGIYERVPLGGVRAGVVRGSDGGFGLGLRLPAG